MFITNFEDFLNMLDRDWEETGCTSSLFLFPLILELGVRVGITDTVFMVC